MPVVDRRRFLQLAGGTAALSVLTPSIARAASIPAHRATGSIEDVEHVVVLIQENRSFDHYFGTLRGVRGYGDPHPAVLPGGRSVFHQAKAGTETLPFRPDKANLGLTFIQDLAHDWDSTHVAFDQGRYDQWIAAKSTTTMAHLQRNDIPFHYALADAFTICDDYHCSLLGPTDPNRYYAWTGWVGNDGKGGGPVIANDEIGYSWTTYPERLQDAGVSWKIYQDEGVGLDAAGYYGYTDDAYIGNYGDTSLLYFTQYQDAPASSPLAKRARTGTDASAGQSLFATLTSDVKKGTLPQVSWIVAPEAFTEHPNWPANYGAWYVSQVLDALTSDPDVWAKTALFLTYDENDGFFDHVVPAYPPVGGLPGSSTVPTTNELYPGSGTTPGGSTGTVGPYGMGVRVPMTVISPWSTGGWVCSETFDHTSMLQFLEKRFGVTEPNITPWRRAVAGDLTSAFDFSRSGGHVPTLPNTAAYEPTDDQRHPDYVPVPPKDPTLPVQERGTRPSRALGYDLDVSARLASGALTVTMVNRGRLGAHLQARSLSILPTPAAYTVGRGRTVTASLPVAGAYDLDVHGPNGFFRRFAGSDAVFETALVPGGVAITNNGKRSVTVSVVDAYAHARTVTVGRGRTEEVRLTTPGGWYDVTVSAGDCVRQLAGRTETGEPSISDPQLGG